MNVILFESRELGATVTIDRGDRRATHVRQVLRASDGDQVRVGEIGGRLGSATVRIAGKDVVFEDISLDREPPPPLPVTLVLALPRPKVLNRVLASAASMGIKRIHLINSWRVDKSYWKSPKLDPHNLKDQCIAGLEQGVDTIMPEIRLHRLFRPFVEQELDEIAGSSLRLVAHPRGAEECPRAIREATTIAIGPEGGFIEAEIESFEAKTFRAVRIGPRVLRVETAVAALIGRLV